MSPSRDRRAVGAVHGLALGDALGAPASEHRTVRDPFVRQTLRRGRAELDEARVLRPIVPFVLTDLGTVALVGTDDAELFAVAAMTILGSPSLDVADLFQRWRRLMDTPGTWTGTAQRSALLNAEAGLVPPQTGRDNPAFYDDTALPGALAAAIAIDDPTAASGLASTLAQITHDGIGIEAAGLYAGVLSRYFSGATVSEGIDDAVAESALDGWLRDGIDEARLIVSNHSVSPFAAVPALVARFAPRTYSHPGTAAETLPLALALTEATQGDHEQALPLAFSITRHQDSLPALVGALCGALESSPDGSTIDVLSGITIPAVKGCSLASLAAELAGAQVTASR